MASILSYVQSLKILRSRIFWVVLMIAASLTVVSTSTLLSTKSVTVTDHGISKSISTGSRTVGDMLKKQGIALNEGDVINPSLNFALQNGQTIVINRAFPVTINLGGEIKTFRTTNVTVGELLKKNNIVLGQFDIAKPSLDSVITQNTEINVIRVTKTQETVKEAIPFDTTSEPNEKLERGRTVVAQDGQNGVKGVVYQVIMYNGKEQSREAVSESIITKPVNKISQYGTMYVALNSRSSSSRDREANQSNVANATSSVNVTSQAEASNPSLGNNAIICSASAYDLSYESCGKSPGDPGYGMTATGVVAHVGIVAVDPSVIPLGTKLYIKSMDGYPDYGYAVAGDTGSGIYGNCVDLFMNSRADALNFGRRSVKVYILN